MPTLDRALLPEARRAQLAGSARRLVRDRVALLGAALVLLVVLATLLGPLATPFDPAAIGAERLSPPTLTHPLGTDELGRDLLARVLWGGRVSLPVSLAAVALAAGLGVLIGLVAGYYAGWADALLMRAMDILLAFPSLVLALALLAVLGPDIRNLVFALAISTLPAFARLARAMAVTGRAELYTESARAVGARDRRILTRYILPNAMAPLIVAGTSALGGLILTEAALSFLGVGVQPPTPSWGMMLNTGKSYMESSPWVSLWPGAAIFLTVLGFNLLGDGIRDITDPRLRRG